jgi:hypothetical protein
MAITTAASSALRVAASILSEYADEDPRIAGLVLKQQAMADSAEAEQAADRLASQSPNASETVRKAQQIDYLRAVSPSAADAWTAGQAARAA